MARWLLNSAYDKKLAWDLNQSLQTPDIIGQLLVQRGINSYTEAERFFRPQSNHLHSPNLMLGMEVAVNRLLQAKEKGEKIWVYGDYDVDGTCSVAIVEALLSLWGYECTGYQPDRFSEGYGISQKGIEAAAATGSSLMIALDCGITAVDKVALAKSLGLDVIICDHHLPKEMLPDAVAILNPKQKGCTYPFKELCGCGIGYKLMQALAQSLNKASADVEAYLDIVALATAADIVSLRDENRVLVSLGLVKATQNPSAGVAALLKVSGSSRALSCRDLVFQLAPRINAAGRLYHAQKAKNILLGREDCEALSVELNKINAERQALGKVVQEEAMAQAQQNPYKFSQVLHAPHWNKGVIGIVASKIIEAFYKPCLVLAGGEDGVYSGSARTIDQVNVYQALQTCDHLFESFGGHNAAAGFKIKEANIGELKILFDAACAKQLDHKIPEENLMADAMLDIAEINTRILRICEQFEPCGPDNMSPRFIAQDAILSEKRIIGKDAKHLKLRLSSAKNTDVFYDAPLWNMAEKINELPEAGEAIQLLYALEMNTFMGKSTIQLRVYDYKV